MTDLNQLKTYMDFYKANGLGPKDYSNGMGFNPTHFNTDALAANWAMQQMGPQQGRQGSMPDYFSGQTDPLKPMGPDPYADRVKATQGVPYAQRPVSGMVNNYLATLLQGKR